MTSRRSVPLRRLAIVGVLGVLTAVAVSPVIGGNGIGAVFNLGKTNGVNATTTLKGSSTTRMLQVTNIGNGAALQLTTKVTAPPMKVNSSVKVANLNADKLDGLDSTSFMAAGTHPDAATVQGLDATALMAPGEIVRTVASGWLSLGLQATAHVDQYASSTYLSATAAGTVHFVLQPVTPDVENGWQYGLSSAVVCANGSGGAVLGDITLEQMLANGASSVVGTATDPGPHAVGTCHTLTLSSPVATGHTTLLVSITASYPGGTVSIGDVTFHWVPVAKA